MSTNINSGHNAGRRKRRKRTDNRPSNGPVTSITVDPQVWAEALRLAGGNFRRIERHAGSVIVRNHAWQVNHG